MVIIFGIIFLCLYVTQALSSDDTGTKHLMLIVQEQNAKILELEKKFEKLANAVFTINKKVTKHTPTYGNEKYKSLSYDMDELKNKSRSGIPQVNKHARMSRQLSEGAPVAFYAVMTRLVQNVVAHQQLVFDAVKTNVGGGYHPSGVFIVPETGLYVFTWSFRVRDAGYHSVELTVNGNVLGAGYGRARDHLSHQTSATVVISVNKGDDVFLRTGSLNNNGEIYTDSYGYTYFAGWKVGV